MNKETRQFIFWGAMSAFNALFCGRLILNLIESIKLTTLEWILFPLSFIILQVSLNKFLKTLK